MEREKTTHIVHDLFQQRTPCQGSHLLKRRFANLKRLTSQVRNIVATQLRHIQSIVTDMAPENVAEASDAGLEKRRVKWYVDTFEGNSGFAAREGFDCFLGYG